MSNTDESRSSRWRATTDDKPPLRERLYRGTLLFFLAISFATAVLLPRVIVIIPAGFAGVLFETINGGVDPTQAPLTEGLHLILPWNTVTQYDLRIQNDNETYDVIASNGLHFQAEIAFRYRPCYNALTQLHQDVGPEYLRKLLMPQIGALMREVIAQCEPEQVISSERPEIQELVLSQLRRDFSHSRIAGEDEQGEACAFPRSPVRLFSDEPVELKPVPIAPTDTAKLDSGDAGATDPGEGDASDSRRLRLLAFQREIGQLRGTLTPEYLAILRQADVLATDEDLDTLLSMKEDRTEACGIAKSDFLSLINSSRPRAAEHFTGRAGGDLFYIQDVLLRSIILPPRVRDAIERKVEQEQLLREYRFRVKRELMESLRKEAEAEGVRRFQQTINGTISEDYLRWRGIEATVRLATSPNSKLVILGGGKDRLPIILNPESFGDGKSPAAPAAQNSEAQTMSGATADSDSPAAGESMASGESPAAPATSNGDTSLIDSLRQGEQTLRSLLPGTANQGTETPPAGASPTQ